MCACVVVCDIYLVSSEGEFSGAEVGERSDEVCRDIHRHDTLLVSVLANDGMTDETFHY